MSQTSSPLASSLEEAELPASLREPVASRTFTQPLRVNKRHAIPIRARPHLPVQAPTPGTAAIRAGIATASGGVPTSVGHTTLKPGTPGFYEMPALDG
jgi:hypothetical protein